MRTSFKKTLFFISISLFVILVNAQTILPRMLDVAPLSPSAASLGKYGTFPVNLNTGLIDISVPIYEIKTSKLTVPITLSYHPSGVRVNDVSTWAGLGWTLMAGGGITRSIMGKVDELSAGYLSTLSVQEIKNTGDISFDRNQLTIQNYLTSIESFQIDPEPDIFEYNCLGSSGRFVYNKDKTSLVRIPFDKSKVTLDFPNNLITIVEKDGTTYRFGKAIDGTNYFESSSYDNFGNEQFIGVPVNWLLTTIISADKKDTIQFKYTQNSGTYIADKVERFTVYSEHQGLGTTLPPAGTNSSTLKDLNGSSSEQLLSEIAFRNGKVTFETLSDRTDIPGAKRLNLIKIFCKDALTGAYVLQKKVQFTQSYFTGGERMRLDAIGFFAAVGSQAQTYQFSYNTTALPTRMSYGRDYWGFYNGATGNTSLIPPISIPEGTGYLNYNTSINRAVNFSFAKAASLEKITYPTGGFTEFEYEANSYLDGATTKLAGGLRIRQTRSYDGKNPLPIKKTYVYGDGTISVDGQRSYRSIVTSLQVVDEVGGGPGGCGIVPESIKVNCFTSSPSIDLTNYDGSIVVYSNVTEYNGDQTTNQGRTEYVYQNFPDNIGAYAFPTQYYREINSWRRGQLLQQTVYDKNGSPVAKVINTYSSYIDTLFQLEGFLLGRVYTLTNSCLRNQNCTGCGSAAVANQWSFANYSIRSGITKLVQSVNYAYDQKDPTKYSATTTDYTYDNTSYQPSVVSVTNSINEKLVTKYLYPSNYAVNPSSTDETSKGIKLLTDNNILTNPIEIYQQRQATDNSLRTIKGIFTTYRSDLPVPSAAYGLEINTPVTNFTPSFVSGMTITKDSRYRLAVSFNQYDAAANITEQNKANDIVQSYLWGYKYSYPVAQIVGVSYSSVLTTPNLIQSVIQNPASDQALRDELNKIRQAFPAALVTTYTYKPLIGLTSLTDVNNKTTYYTYDPFGRLALVRDKDNNILKKYCYNYNGQTEDCNINYNQVQSGVFYKSGCTGCLTGSAVTYTVPANTYSAPTVSDANQLAINDVAANGQAYADANGTCVAPSSATVSGSNGNNQTHSFYFHNNCTGTNYNFSMGPNASLTTLGSVPVGNYNVTFNPPVGTGQYTYRIGSLTLHANSGTISNVTVGTGGVIVLITP